MTRLSVNINKIATLRNARGGNIPDLLRAAKDIQRFGAEGITVHPRPDERHIRRKDVFDLKTVVYTEFNIEGYPSEGFIQMVKEVFPEQVTLVPDPDDVLTSNAGWDTKKNLFFLKEIVSELKKNHIRVSLFVDPDKEMIRNSKEAGADRVELYTEKYAREFPSDKARAIAPYSEAAKFADEIKIGLNAGHDLSLHNLKYFSENIPGLLEVSIGHALIPMLFTLDWRIQCSYTSGN
jgi:pyridoxine 5-phosphate synthase